MRLLIVCSTGLALLMASTLFAAPMDDAEKEMVMKEVLRRITITPKRVEGDALNAVFAATFYTAEIEQDLGGGASTSMEMRLVRHGDKFVDVPSASTDSDMPGLVRIVKDGFLIGSKEQAKTFEKALDVVYPMSSFGKEKKAKAILQKGTTWTFVRGTFFEDKKGFIVSTDEAGKITHIRFALRLPKE